MASCCCYSLCRWTKRAPSLFLQSQHRTHTSAGRSWQFASLNLKIHHTVNISLILPLGKYFAVPKHNSFRCWNQRGSIRWSKFEDLEAGLTLSSAPLAFVTYFSSHHPNNVFLLSLGCLDLSRISKRSQKLSSAKRAVQWTPSSSVVSGRRFYSRDINFLTWATRIKRTSCTSSTHRDIPLIPIYLGQRDDTDICIYCRCF